MTLGKDGKPWDKTRWVEWAASPSSSKFKSNKEAIKTAREKHKSIKWFCPKCFTGPLKSGRAIAKHRRECQNA